MRRDAKYNTTLLTWRHHRENNSCLSIATEGKPDTLEQSWSCSKIIDISLKFPVNGRTTNGRADGRRLQLQVLLDEVDGLRWFVVVEVGTGNRRFRHSERRTIIWQSATDVVRPLIIFRLKTLEIFKRMFILKKEYCEWSEWRYKTNFSALCIQVLVKLEFTLTLRVPFGVFPYFVGKKLIRNWVPFVPWGRSSPVLGITSNSGSLPATKAAW